MSVQEVEKLKILQTEREALRNRLKERVKEHEKKAEDYTETVCPECGSRQLVHDYERAELVCQNCGLVIDDDFIDRGPEWRAFDHDQRMKELFNFHPRRKYGFLCDDSDRWL